MKENVIKKYTDENGKTMEYMEVAKSDMPSWLDSEWFKNGGAVHGRHRESVTMRIPKDVVDFYRASGKGYQTRMNDVLQAYAEAHANKK